MKIKSKRHFWLGSLAIIAALLLTIGCQASAAQETAVDQTNETITAFVGDLSASTGATGKIVALRAAELMLPVTGEVTDIPVAVGDKVTAGELLVQLNTTDLARAVAQAEQHVLSQEAALADLEKPATSAELAAAETAVSAAQSRLGRLHNGPTADEIAAAEANVRAAEANVWAASNRLNAARDGANDADVQAAQLEVDDAQRQHDSANAIYLAQADCKPNSDGTHDCTFDRSKPGAADIYWNAAAAQASLDRAQAILTNLRDGNPHSIAVAQAEVSVAAAQRDAAQARLDLLVADATPADIASAEAELAQAQSRLTTLQDGAKPEQIEMATAQVEQAKLALARAIHDLEQASLVAPFDGVVTAVHVRKGEQATGLAITLVDDASTILALNVNEIDLRHVTIGQTANVTLETWPDQSVDGTVTMIAAENLANHANGTIVYRVHLQLDETDLPLRIGMTGNADLITAERKDVLLLPNRAITTNFETGESFVNLVEATADGETVTQVAITTGARGGQYTEIVDGLQAGDQVQIIGAPPPAEVDIFEE